MLFHVHWITIFVLYYTVKQLGAGATGRVLKARDQQNGLFFALKQIAKDQSGNLQSLVHEYKILRKLKVHPNIVSLHDVYCDELCYYIATGYCSGGTMLKKILRMKSFSEKKAAGYIQSILSAVQYMVCLSVILLIHNKCSLVWFEVVLCLLISMIWI